MQNQWLLPRLEENLLNVFQLNWMEPLAKWFRVLDQFFDSVHKPACLELVQFQFQFQFNKPAMLSLVLELGPNWATVNRYQPALDEGWMVKWS
jgi:hypothetical protein